MIQQHFNTIIKMQCTANSHAVVVAAVVVVASKFDWKDKTISCSRVAPSIFHLQKIIGLTCVQQFEHGSNKVLVVVS